MDYNAAVHLDSVIRDYLRLHSIKLWDLEVIPETIIDDLLHCLCVQYPREAVYSSLVEIQKDIKARMSAQSRHNTCRQTSEQAESDSSLREESTLGFTVKALISSEISEGPNQLRFPVSINSFGATGAALIGLILAHLNISQSTEHVSVKLIFKGRNIRPSNLLSEYALASHSVVLAFVTSTPKGGDKDGNSQSGHNKHLAEETNSIREAARTLSKNKLEILNQDGRPIEMDKKDRKLLTSALALSEQGKKMAGDNKYAEALFAFLEADEDFKSCKSNVLDLVDNYALLQLDIVWCYLQLRSLDQLPDGANRLEMCEKKLAKTFGPSFSRVEVIKGREKASQEKALFVRLHLLKGVVSFYLRQYSKALEFLNSAKDLIAQLDVDQFALNDLMMLGFDEGESRLALRACANDITSSVEHILSERERLDRIQTEIEQDKRRELLQNKLGFTLKGNPVNISHYEALRHRQNFPKLFCGLALKRFDNDFDKCVNILENSNYRELLHAEQPLDQNYLPVDEEKLVQLGEFTSSVPPGDATSLSIMHVATALFISQNDVQKAYHLLQSNPSLKKATSLVEKVWLGVDIDDEDELVEEEKKKIELDAAQDKLSRVITNQKGNDYLDLDFKMEIPLINQYIALLGTFLK